MRRRAANGVLEQAHALTAALGSLDDSTFVRPVPRSGDPLTVLVGSLVVTADALNEALATTTTGRPTTLADHYRGERLRRHDREDLALELADHESGRALVAQLGDRMAQTAELLDETVAPEVVLAGRQALRTADLLRAVTIELLLASDDVAQTVPDAPLEWSRTALGVGVRALAEIIAQRHPGHSIELRVPPYAAVQCGMGDDPTHTRGTPPNVVETDPRTFLRLAHGSAEFAAEVARGAVSASGTRSDLSAWFPVIAA